MKEEILSEVRPFVFRDVLTKVSGMLDQYRLQLAATHAQSSDGDPMLLRDQVDHLIRALTMISGVPETVEGAMMARGIAEEAISTTSTVIDDRSETP